MIKYRNRIIDKILKKQLLAMGGILIEGLKWCGKTTTGMHFSNSILRIDEPGVFKQNVELASVAPQSLLEGKTPRLIDEWQFTPSLWDAARYEIDKRSKQGQFIFTGSSVPADLSKLLHSGAGRFAWVKMRTMSLFESGDSTGEVSLWELFNKDSDIHGIKKHTIEDLSYLICRGGWPHSIGMDKNLALLVSSNYYDALVHYDINRADGISKNADRVKRIMRSFARNQGAQVAYTTLKKDIMNNDVESINEDTIATYIDALKKIFVIEDMPSWNPNLRSKIAVRTSENRYYSDPSIAAAALGIGPSDLSKDINTLGLLFETLCVRDLRIYSESLDGSVYHYRDSKGLECDSVVHLKNGKYGLIEIKLGGDKLIAEGAKTLNKLKNKIDTNKMGLPSFMMVLTGVGTYAYKRDDGIYIVPIGCLKD